MASRCSRSGGPCAPGPSRTCAGDEPQMPKGGTQAKRGVYSPAVPCPWTQATFPGLATARPAVGRGARVCHVLVGEARIPVQLGFWGHVRLTSNTRVFCAVTPSSEPLGHSLGQDSRPVLTQALQGSFKEKGQGKVGTSGGSDVQGAAATGWLRVCQGQGRQKVARPTTRRGQAKKG